MRKMSGLERMRMARDQREAQTTEPLRQLVNYWSSQHRALREAFRKLERAMGTKLDEQIMNIRSVEAWQLIKHAILNEVRRIGQPPTSLLIRIDAPFMRRDTLEAYALDEYRRKAIPGLGLSLPPPSIEDMKRTASFTVRRIRVSLPAISFDYEVPEISSRDRSMAEPAQPAAR